MIVVDGSMGEGGGQVLRTAIALSALTLKPIKIVNIRAKRSNPGLRPQHMIAVKAVASLCKAEVEGLKVNSTKLTFVPKERVAGRFEFNIGTAGSVSLVLQALLPVAAFAPSACNFRIIGGTDVPWSPPIDYLKNVFLPVLQAMGYTVDIKVIRRGHYPRGGGVVEVRTEPINALKAVNRVRRGEVTEIQGVSHAVRLPSHVARRQAEAAKRYLSERGYGRVEIDLEFYEADKDPHLGPGSGIVLWALSDNGCILGADALGARGKPAEEVGREAAEKMVNELKTGMAFDRHMADMLIPYLALAEGSSIVGVSSLTLHALTNISLTELILGVKFKVEGGKDSPSIVRVEGLGFSA